MRPCLSLLGMLLLLQPLAAAEPLPLLLEDDFEQGAARWEPTDPAGWQVKKTEEGPVFSQHKKRSDYNPPHRSPFNIALLKEVHVGDFKFTTRVKSTHPDYGHRDVVLVFGYQDPAHFYYVHLGKETDDHANQIFIVNDAPRVKISKTTSSGTPWDDQWHTVRVVRRVESGAIEVFFDDLEKPVMTAEDRTFTWGRVGIGTFDDTSDWDKVELRGRRVEKP